MSESMSFDDELRKLLHRDPFMAFSLFTSGGQRYEITDRHAMAIGPDVLVVLHPRTGMSLLRRHQIVSVDAATTAE